MKKTIYIFAILVLFISACSKDSGNTIGSGNSVGQGGSLARFTIVINYLYTVEGESLSVFDIMGRKVIIQPEVKTLGGTCFYFFCTLLQNLNLTQVVFIENS